jgi:hypothetical protein
MRNKPAIAFYKRRGFRAAGTQDFLFGKEVQQDIVMFRQVETAVIRVQ